MHDEHPPSPGTNGEDLAELFRETQPFHQNMIVRVLVPFELVMMGAMVVPLMLTATPRPGIGAWVGVAAASLGIPAALLLIRMKTIVTTRELVVHYRPFPGRRIPIERVRSATAIAYDPLASGGWGWRISKQYHRVFNVSGERGVHVVWGDTQSEQALLGSRDADELAEAIALARFSHETRDGRSASDLSQADPPPR